MAPMVLRRSTAVNNPKSQLCESAVVEIWERLRERIAAMPNGVKREQAWLAEKLGIRVQVVNNWTQRQKMPSSRYEEIAAAVGWSVDELLGKPGPAPSQGVLRRDLDLRLRSLSEREMGRLEHVIEQELDRMDALRRGLPAPAKDAVSVSLKTKAA